MDVSKFLRGDYMTAADLDSEGTLCRIEQVSTATFDSMDGGKVEKVILITDRGSVALNKTNLATIADAYGRNANDWTGQPIKLVREKVNFSGRMVDAIRVKCRKSATKESRPAPAAKPETRPAIDDIDIPF
jgi:hypothetical protein